MQLSLKQYQQNESDAKYHEETVYAFAVEFNDSQPLRHDGYYRFIFPFSGKLFYSSDNEHYLNPFGKNNKLLKKKIPVNLRHYPSLKVFTTQKECLDAYFIAIKEYELALDKYLESIDSGVKSIKDEIDTKLQKGFF